MYIIFLLIISNQIDMNTFFTVILNKMYKLPKTDKTDNSPVSELPSNISIMDSSI